MLETIIVIALIVVFGMPVFMNTIGPFIIWKTQKVPTVVKFEPLEEEGFLQERNEIFQQYDKELNDLGFAGIGASILKDSHTASIFSLYWHADRKVAAMVVTISSKLEEMTYMEIGQKYSDGSVLDVSNSSRPEAYPQLDIKTAFRFPRFLHADELLDAHRVLREKYKADLHPVDYDVSRGFYEIEQFLRRESDALLAQGIVKEDIDADGKRALTLYGALALTYRSISPGKNIMGYISERRAEAALTGP